MKVLHQTHIIILFLLIGGMALSCKSTDSGATSKKSAIIEGPNIEKLTVIKQLEIQERDMFYKLKNVHQEAEMLVAKVEYSGGCVKPHDFDLITTSKINQEGIMDVYIVDKTHNDNCKMLVMTEVYFDIGKITRLRSKKLKGFRINDSQLFLTTQK